MITRIAQFFALASLASAQSLPSFEADTAWPKIPAQYKLGDASSVAVDKDNHIWVLHRPRTLQGADAANAAPPIVIFDQSGNFIRAWGGASTERNASFEWPEREHGIHIDAAGFVWIGGNNCPARALPGLKPLGDDQYLKFTPAGKFVLQIGKSTSSKGNADTANFHQPADAFVHRNELFVADGYGNHRVIVLDASTGKFKRMWGAFGNGPVDKDDCPPPSLNSVPDGPGPDQFSIVHAIRVANDGLVYVADRENRRVQMFTSQGKFVKQLVRGSAPFARSLALSRDKDQRYLYVGGGTDIAIVDRKTLEIVKTIQGNGIVGGGHQMETDLDGNLYVAATNRGVQKLVLKSSR
jgi:hypothetical protein